MESFIRKIIEQLTVEEIKEILSMKKEMLQLKKKQKVISEDEKIQKFLLERILKYRNPLVKKDHR